MNSSELGRRIKEARLAKKLTQTEVAGDFITRNMLSQIESGTANPSLKTLEYLTSVLDIPIQALLPDGKDEKENTAENDNSLTTLSKCKKYLNEGKYIEAVEAANTLTDSQLYDEACAITARSYLNLAENAEQAGDLNNAADWAYKAYNMADKGMYASRDIKTVSALLMNKIAEKLGK